MAGRNTVKHPTGNPFAPAASIETLRHRAESLRGVRDVFDAHDYWEVETPTLSRDVVVDAHLEPFSIQAENGTEYFLQTSPEFGMKRLLAAGADAIFQITRAMRSSEFGRLHNPEFTIVEWYRVGDTPIEQMTFAETLVSTVMQKAGRQVNRPFERITYDDAFRRFVGTPVLAKSVLELAILANDLGVETPPGTDDWNRDQWLNLLLAERVEPNLGRDRPLFLYDYPASQAALARVRPTEPPVAERFELYVGGIELCNGYHELNDADELRRRIKEQSAIRIREGHRQLPLESALLSAMDFGLPNCTGVALGFDRLVMLALQADSLSEVMAFPFDRA